MLLFFINLFIDLFLAVLGLHWCMQAFSFTRVSGGYSQLRCAGFSLRWLLQLRSTGSRRAGFSSCSRRAQQLWLVCFSSCGMQAQLLWLMGSRVQAQQLWCTGLVAPQHVGSSWTRARTRVPCIGRRILNHCTTREALLKLF